MNNLYYLFIVLGFLAVVLFLEGTYLAWNAYRGPEAKRMEKRLRAMSAGAEIKDSSLLKQRMLAQTPTMDRLLLQIPRIHQLDRLLMQSGLRLTVAGFLGLTLLLTMVGFLLALLLGMPALIVIVIGAGAGMLPLLYVTRAKYKRLLLIEQQLPDSLDLMARAMLAGHAFTSGLKMVGEETSDPVAGEFSIVFDEINYGISVQDALVNLATRVPSTDLRYFVISVLIQRETGGNLAELLSNISALIRARLKLMGAVRVFSAEGRLSALILTILPFALAGVIFLINSEFLSVLWTDPVGPKIVAGALMIMIFGIFWMWRVIKIRV
ncbi:MAG: pilus assembly protein TadB [Methylotenera sp.]|nr:MAG: pilus assembly protein TadB [Methylotenera sp.]